MKKTDRQQRFEKTGPLGNKTHPLACGILLPNRQKILIGNNDLKKQVH